MDTAAVGGSGCELIGLPPSGQSKATKSDEWDEARDSSAGRPWTRGGNSLLLVAAVLALVVGLAEGFAALQVVTVGQSEWVPAIPVVAIGVVALVLGLIATPLATRAAVTFVVASIAIGALIAWWSVNYSLADKVAWNGAANLDAQVHLAHATFRGRSQCPKVEVGLPLPSGYSRCTFDWGRGQKSVMYEAEVSATSVAQLLYEPRSHSPGLPDECVRQLTGGWWAGTNTAPQCPDGYHFMVGP